MSDPAPLLSVERISIAFDAVSVLQDATLQIPRRQIGGLIGPNGSGKTTLFNCVSGYYRPSGGRIMFDGRETTNASPHVVARMGIGRTFQTPNLFGEMTLRENMLLAVENMACGSTLRGLSLASKGMEAKDRVNALLAKLGLSAYADTMPAELPVGIAKLGDLGRALSTGPKLLLLDEPAVGLNDGERQKLIALLLELNKTDGLSMLVVDHNMSFVTALCEQITVLASGAVIKHGSPAEVRADPAVIQVYLGETDAVA